MQKEYTWLLNWRELATIAMFSNIFQATSKERLLITAKLLTSIRIFLLITQFAALPRMAQVVSKVHAEITRYRIGSFGNQETAQWLQSDNGAWCSNMPWLGNPPPKSLPVLPLSRQIQLHTTLKPTLPLADTTKVAFLESVSVRRM